MKVDDFLFYCHDHASHYFKIFLEAYIFLFLTYFEEMCFYK